MSNLIERQAAIDAIENAIPPDPMMSSDMVKGRSIGLAQACILLSGLPAARRAAKPTVMPLICLRCKKDIPLTFDTFAEISYTHYSYCEDCLRKGLALLRAKDKEENNEQRD